MTRRAAKTLTFEEVAERVAYDPDSGVVTSRRTGKPIGYVGYRAHGYLCIDLLGARLKRSHVAWLLMTGVWPSGVIDHINRDSADDRWSNLRHCTQGQNAINALNPRSRFRGVVWHARSRKWRARVALNRRQISFGEFADLADALLAYVENAPKVHGEFFPMELLRPHLDYLKEHDTRATAIEHGRVAASVRGAA